MAIEHRAMSVSQFAELMGFEPHEFRGVEWTTSTVLVVLETEDENGADHRNVPTLARQHQPAKATEG